MLSTADIGLFAELEDATNLLENVLRVMNLITVISYAFRLLMLVRLQAM